MADARRTDRELLAGFCRAGDRSAMEEFVLRHQPAAWRLAWRILGNSADASDAVQEAVLRAMRSARAFRGEGSAAGWFRRIAASAALDLARRRERRARHEQRAALEGGNSEMLNELERAEALEVLGVELAALPAELRTAAVLRHAESMTDAAAAGALGWSRRTFSARASAALERLRERFRRRKELAGTVLLIPALIGEVSVPGAPASLVAILKTAVLTGKLAAPWWWLALMNGGKAMVTKTGLAALAALAIAVGGTTLDGNPARGARAAQPAAARVKAVPAAFGKGGAAKPVSRPASEAVKPKEDVATKVTQGALRVLKADGTYAECPLKHTDVKVEISGFIARVNLVQTFTNPSKKRIEAVYVFPLSHTSAVDSMSMLIGERKITGLIKRRSVAERIYQAALARGATAAVLHQERPNIFTQKVGNIPPGGTVRIAISYVDVLKYDMGRYSFHFPMVVGPRYNPAGWTQGIGAVPAGKTGASGQSVEVKYTKRSGHDISLSLKLNAGVPIQGLKSANHAVDMKQTGERTAVCAIKAGDNIPNKDFVLEYAVVGRKPEMAVLAHATSGKPGYFTLMIQPSDNEALRKAPPREITFLVDVSGSMGGAPTAKVQQCLKLFLKQSRARDKIQLITFAGANYKMFPKPVLATPANVKKVLAYSQSYSAGGGTMMLPAIRKALGDELDKDRVRIVIMLTDGYIGNEKEIIAEVGKRCGDKIRFWCLGIGSSVNRLLVDGVAKQGGGMGKVLGVRSSQADTEKLVAEVVYRIHRAQLADIAINWGTLNVFETYPARIPELWAGRPVIVHGRYTGGGKARIFVTGNAEGRAVSWPLVVDLPVKEPKNDVLATVWARKKIESLMDQVWVAGSPQMVEEVTKIALEHKLMSQYTSFVAVDPESGAEAGMEVEPPVRIPVAVPLPDGTEWAGFFGGGERDYERLGIVLDDTKIESKLDHLPGPYHGPVPSAEPMTGKFGFLEKSRRYGPGKSWREWDASFRKEATKLNRLARGGKNTISDIPLGGTGLHGLFGYRPGDGRSRAGYPPGGERRGIVIFTDGVDDDLVDSRDRYVSGPDRTVAGRFHYGIREGLAKKSAAGIKRAAGLLEAAGKEKDLAKKRALLQWAYLYDYSWRAMGWQTAGTMQKAAAGLDDLEVKLAARRLAAEPRLKGRLKLVLRDKSLTAALGQVAVAAGLVVDVQSRAITVAAELAGRKDLRVTYMDLRRATAAQAFDWLLKPYHLDWDVAEGKVQVTAASRGRIAAPWTYDVAALALPRQEEFKGIKDAKKLRKQAGKLAADFLAAVRTAAGSQSTEICFWLPAGRIVVFGDAAAHTRVRTLLDELKKGVGEHGALGEVVKGRWEARKAAIERSRASREKAEVYGALYWSSWQLLASAAAGRSDLEALARLEVAWRRPFAAKLAANRAPVTALRGAWVLTESALALPQDKELAELAARVLAKVEKGAEGALAALEKSAAKKEENAGAYLATLYAALALRNGNALGIVSKDRLTSFNDRAAKLLVAEVEKSPLAGLRLIARALLLGAGKVDGKQMTKLFDAGLAGDDLNVLAALAARKAGGRLWLAFRASARQNFSKSGVSGAVVLMANRLAQSRLPSAK